jgi:2-polyprenyl-3-methyl-5-hydroxy-6-metoxy-1,4-benzoquinol methylase
MSIERTREAQYQPLLEIRQREGLARLGLMTNQVWRDDPKRLLFVLARYKFVAKMLKGRRRVLEVGCADAFGTRVVRQEVGALVAVDFDPVFIADAQDRADLHWPVEYRVHDLLAGPVAGPFDAAYCLDVIEHIDVRDEDRFIANMARSLTPHGAVLVGSPSLESQAYASPQSKEGHVNCKDERGLRELMERHFENVFLFSMNDEVVHTGFAPMAHYRMALCCSVKPAARRDGESSHG